MSDTIKVACRVPNGIMLHLWKQGIDEPFKTMVKDGDGVRLAGIAGIDTGAGNTERADLAPGISEVPAEWWAKWVEQNRGKNPLLDTGAIYALDDAPSKDENQ
jgi:hypothetical protein